MKNAIIYYCLCCVLVTLIPFLPFDYWVVRIFDFPHAQFTFLTFAGIVAMLASIKLNRRILFLFILLVTCFIYQLSIVYPYTVIGPQAVQNAKKENPDSKISLLASNVLMKNRNAEPLKKEIEKKQPDIIILLEADSWWQKNMQYLKKDYHAVEKPLGNTYGLLLYSKYKLVDPQIKFLIEDTIPSAHTKVLLPSGQLVQLYAVHPTPPTPNENASSAERDGELMVVGKMAKKSSLPVIVAGDLNDVAWSSSTKLFLKVSELLDPRKGRGLFNTFNAKIPLLRWPLDHIFHSGEFRVSTIERLPYIGSDHFPVFIKLFYEPDAKIQQNEPRASHQQMEKAEKQIKKAKNK